VHTVFGQPLKVQINLEDAPTPAIVKKTAPARLKIGDTMKVLNIQRLSKRPQGVVSPPLDVNEHGDADAETIMMGLATSQPYGAVAIGRHGNFLQWGYGGSPAEMTEAGKRLFINCISYVSKFNGQTPLIYKQAYKRARVAQLLNSFARNSRGSENYLPKDLLEKYKDNMKGLANYYADNNDLIYQDSEYKYLLDEDLMTLGFKTNHEIGTLEKLSELLDSSEKAEIARKILQRYTGQQFQTAQQCRTWINQNRSQLFFCETGGYRFYVNPKK